jgi:hypothetical protein
MPAWLAQGGSAAKSRQRTVLRCENDLSETVSKPADFSRLGLRRERIMLSDQSNIIGATG